MHTNIGEGEAAAMSKRYLRSDMSEQEARFYTSGNFLWGDENACLGLFKLVGKYSELVSLSRGAEIINYRPEVDRKFKYENMGYTVIASRLRAKYINENRALSRKYLKNLCRKRKFSRMVLSFDSSYILAELINYIRANLDLDLAFQSYLIRNGSTWDKLIPSQFEFLSIRHTYQHKNYKIAGEIINELSAISLK